MIEYYYRKIGTVDFEKSSEPKTVLPIRLKNMYEKEQQYFCSETQKWKTFSGDYDSLIADSPQLVPAEFIQTLIYPKFPEFHYDPIIETEVIDSVYPSNFYLESLNASQLSEYMDYVEKKHRYNFYLQNCKDSENMEKNNFSIFLETDEENLSLRITIKSFGYDYIPASIPDGEPNIIPIVEDNSVCFDLKNGTIEGCLSDISVLKRFESEKIPKALRKHIFQIFLELVQRFTKIPYESLLERYCEVLDKYNFEEIFKLTKLPYEPDLYIVLSSGEFEKRKTRFNYTREDPNIYAKFCEKLGIQNTKTVRRCFNKRPQSLLTYLQLKDCGFTDINLYNRVLGNKKYYSFIDGTKLKPLKFFTLYSIKERGEIATMNTLLKCREETSEFDLFDERDSLEMFERFFEHIPETLRNDILRDGFTRFNHDALSNISYRCLYKNRTFNYSAEQRALCDNIDGYEFCLPENTYHLLEIGTALHNCVATYDDSVLKKYCTIVYAKKDGEYKICIEVHGNIIIQERTNHNEKPSDSEQKVLDEWHLRHKLLKQ